MHIRKPILAQTAYMYRTYGSASLFLVYHQRIEIHCYNIDRGKACASSYPYK